MKELFSPEDRHRILEAVERAEARTSGEIVPCVVPSSDDYEVTIWKGASLAAAASIALALMVFRFYEGWGLAWLHAGWGMATLTLIAGTTGALLAVFVPPLKRFLAGDEAMMRAVHRCAMTAFVEEEVFRTRERTGILLFISVFEHRIEVLGDVGIHQKVSAEEWADVVENIRDGTRRAGLVDGLVKAIGMCGTLLEKHGVAPRTDDVNELPDGVQIGKR